MVGVARVENGNVSRVYTKEDLYLFGVISENTRVNPLPDGFYVVKIAEIRESKRGSTYPYCKLVKSLPRSFDELVVNLSEINHSTAKQVVEILQYNYIFDVDISRLKLFLKAIFLNDNNIELFPEANIADLSDEDKILLKTEFDIDVEKLKKKEKKNNEIHRDTQKWNNQNIQK